MERGHLAFAGMTFLALVEGWKPSFPGLLHGGEDILSSEGWKPSFPGYEVRDQERIHLRRFGVLEGPYELLTGRFGI